MHALLLPFAVLAAVFMLSGLVSGLIRRAPLSVPMIFLGLGYALGGFGLLHVELHDQALETVAVVSLAFVLFLDAVNLHFDEDRKTWLAPLLALGPGTLITIGIVAGAAHLIFGISWLESLLLGAILASIDPVVLRDVVRDDRVPRSIRQTLTTEAGANDIVVLPILLILSTVALGRAGGAEDWALRLAQLFLLGPLAGGIVGYVCIRVIETLRRYVTISREYRALYGVGIVLAAYVAGEFVGGSGFLAVFTAGVVIVRTDYDLCDCFLDYGEVTAEMAMLLACILFGALLSSMLGLAPLVPSLLFAVVVLALARPLAISLVLRKVVVSRRARKFIGWFGPRGLSSLLFALLVVSQGVPNGEWLLAVTGVVVTASVVLHGVTATPLIAAYGRAMEQESLPEEREATAPGLFGVERQTVSRISPATLGAWLGSEAAPLVLDLRTRAAFAQGNGIPGSVRVPLGDIEEWGRDRSRERAIVTYCTCEDDESAVRAAQLLQADGYEVHVLAGGLPAWQARYPNGLEGEELAA
ncbi:MAG: cation:proton antiporter [Thermomicrobiales bacterium]